MSHLHHHQRAVGGGGPMAMVPPGAAPPQQQMVAGYTTSGSLVQSEAGEFETMDVSVSVIGLTGIICDAVPSKNKKLTPKKGSAGGGGKPPTPQRKGVNSGGAAAALATAGGGKGGGKKMMKSSSTSLDSANTSTTEGTSYSAGPHADGVPTSAVVTFYRTISSSHSAIASHIPSSPLSLPTSAYGNTSRYMATWPSGDPALGPAAPADGEMSSFKFSRVMKREVVPGQGLGDSASTMYVAEKVRVKVGLVCGSEVLELGVATLLVMGNEMGEAQVNLPIRSLLQGGSGGGGSAGSVGSVQPPDTPKTNPGESSKGGFGSKFRVPTGKKSSAKKASKGMAAFKSDLSRYYKIDENAALRLLVRATPRRDDDPYGVPPPRPGKIDTRFDTPQNGAYNGRFNVDCQSIVSSLHPEETLGGETPMGFLLEQQEQYTDNYRYNNKPPSNGADRTTAAVKENHRRWDVEEDAASWSQMTPAHLGGRHSHPREVLLATESIDSDMRAVAAQRQRREGGGGSEKITPRRKASAQAQQALREKEKDRERRSSREKSSSDRDRDRDRHRKQQTTRASNGSSKRQGRRGSSSVSSVGMVSRTDDKGAAAAAQKAAQQQAQSSNGGCEGGFFSCGGGLCMVDEGSDKAAKAEANNDKGQKQGLRGAPTYDGSETMVTATLSHTPLDVNPSDGSSETGGTRTTMDYTRGGGHHHHYDRRGSSFETGFTEQTGVTSAYYASASGSTEAYDDETAEKTLNTFGVKNQQSRRRAPPPQHQHQQQQQHGKGRRGGGGGPPRLSSRAMRAAPTFESEQSNSFVHGHTRTPTFESEQSSPFVHGNTMTSDRERRRKIKKAKEKLRQYAEQMGVDPEDLVR